MAEITTLSVKHHSRLGPPREALTSWTIQEEPSNRISWTPRAPARPKRLRKTECRELLNPQNTLPKIHIHGSACRCTQSQTENQLQDALLAAKISSLTKTILTTNSIKASPPHRTTPQKLKRSLPRPRSGTPSSTGGILSTLTRLFSASPPPSLVPSSPSLPLQADLVIGAADLDIDKVARYLVLDCPPLPVNAPNHLGITPLMAAMRSPAARMRPKAHLEMVRFLVECCGADVDGVRADRVTGLGESVLSVACGMGAVEVVRYLVGRGVGVDTRLPVGAGIGKAGHGVVLGRGQTALHVAILADQAECVEVLVNQGKADVNAVFDAAGVEEGAVVEGGLKGLRRRTGSVSRNRSDKRPKHPVSALHLAHGSVPCTRVLLEFGANVCAKDGHGRTPLHWAATGGHADVVRMLIGAGADVNASSDDGVASLGAAITSLKNGDEKEGHAEVLRALLQESLEAGDRYKGLELLTSTTVFSSTKEGSNVWEEKVQAAS